MFLINKAKPQPFPLKAQRILRQEVGDHTLVLGLVVGPLSLASELMGVTRTLFLIADDFHKLEQVLDFCVEVITLYGLSQIDAGAHVPLICEQTASPELVSPEYFEGSVLPRLKKTFDAFIQAGAMANMLHVSGRAEPVQPYFPKTGAHMVSIDYPVSMSVARQVLPHICLMGNIKPYSFVEARPEEIEAEAVQLVDDFKDRGGFMLSSGMEVPLESRPENLDALVRAARRESGKGD